MAALAVSSVSVPQENAKLTFQQMQDEFFNSLDLLAARESYQAPKSRKSLSWEVTVIIKSVKLIFPIVYPMGPVNAVIQGPDSVLKHITALGERYVKQTELVKRIKEVFSCSWGKLEIVKKTWTPDNNWVETILHWDPEKGFVEAGPKSNDDNKT